MSDLTGFLLARIAEDEAAAAGWINPATRINDADLWAEVGSRMLAECEAKRRIVELHGLHGRDPSALPCRELASLAAIYADHPDYHGEHGCSQSRCCNDCGRHLTPHVMAFRADMSPIYCVVP